MSAGVSDFDVLIQNHSSATVIFSTAVHGCFELALGTRSVVVTCIL